MKSYRLFIFFLFVSTVLQAQPIKVMLITGGHSFDTVQFFEMFDSFENIEYEHFQQPMANAAIVPGVHPTSMFWFSTICGKPFQNPKKPPT
jgi:hypothetical protein